MLRPSDSAELMPGFARAQGHRLQKLGNCDRCLRQSVLGLVSGLTLAVAAGRPRSRVLRVGVRLPAVGFGVLTIAHVATFGARIEHALRPLDLPKRHVVRTVTRCVGLYIKMSMINAGRSSSRGAPGVRPGRDQW